MVSGYLLRAIDVAVCAGPAWGLLSPLDETHAEEALTMPHHNTSASVRQQEINARLITLINQLDAVLVARVTEVLLDFDLTPTQYAALLMLGCNPGSSSAQLARFVNVTPQSMGVIVTKLEERGLVTREPAEIHSRVLTTTLTRKGHQIMEAADEAARTVELGLREAFAESEVEQLRGLLRRARQALAS